MKNYLSVIILGVIMSGSTLFSQSGGVYPNMGQLYLLSNAKTRSISPENFSGEEGKGGMATLEEGSAARAARELGQGWKVNPYVRIGPGETFTLGEIKDSGVIQHIWMTPTGNYRLGILRFYWDDEEEPSVEVPVGDFFASGWGNGNEPLINSLAVCVNPKSGFNSYWQMPFRKKCKITMENKDYRELILYYQIDYSLTEIPRHAAYFHAQFRRVNPLPFKEVYTIVDGIQGKGHYVGTYLVHGANSPGWWGEGEIKFYMDGDRDFPTICGTGEEDYFCGSYCYEMRKNEDGVDVYTDFSTLYSGFHHVQDPNLKFKQGRFGQYRWHILDPLRFERDLKVTIQSLGWKHEGKYLPLEDDLASVAYWYQAEPHRPFPDLPSKDKLIILNTEPVDHFGKGKEVKLYQEPSPQFNHSPSTLVNGLLGSTDFRDGQWIGFEGNNMEAVVDLGKAQDVSKIKTSFLSHHDSWIFVPKSVIFAVSADGETYRDTGKLQYKVGRNEAGPSITAFEKTRELKHVRFVKVVAENMTICPAWHKGAGGKAWIFVDEIIVK